MTVAELESEKIEQLASEYRAKGYDVLLQPQATDLPGFLTPFSPDMVARSSRGNVVVEIKSARDFDAEQVQRLAEAVESHPTWKFEVVLVNPPIAPDIPAGEELAADEQLARFMIDAEILAKSNQTEAAAVLAWSVVETILRRRARSAAPELERQSSGRLLKHLYSLGVVQNDLYERLLRLMNYRNAVAHGFRAPADVPTISDVLEDIRRLQAAA